MRIALVHHQRLQLPAEGRPAESGSVGLAVFELAVRLATTSEVVVYSPARTRFVASERAHRGVRFVDVPAGIDGWLEEGLGTLRHIAGRGAHPGRPAFASAGHLGLFVRRVARDARRRGCDAIHVVNRSQFAPALRRANPDARLDLFMQCESLARIDRGLAAERASACDVVSGCSSFVTEGIRARLPGVAARCFTSHNGVDVRRFHPADGAPPAHAALPGRSVRRTTGRRGGPGERASDGPRRIVFAGRVSPEKGVHHLVEAFVELAEEDPTLRLELIGPVRSASFELVGGLADDALTGSLIRFHESEHSYARQLVERVPEHLRARVEFVGRVDQDALAARLRRAHVFVHPSVWQEPFGMAVLEALATGLPTIATRSGGIPEFVRDGENGVLVERGSTAAVRDALRALLHDESRRRELGRNARASVLERFTWDHAAERLRKRLLA